ncbi:hypothetical protein [Olleya aquimaris]|uniref:DUF1579 domain-containing protein n=1 Tax=Olleya aquimaris TaxID=639310 RepID=A0A327RAQ0_9FLAO|nr:hypothetical protein [Olleya aquimaris]RAJ13238.1 hypothetical protein LY08_02138 [Olleya aquimaris]
MKHVIILFLALISFNAISQNNDCACCTEQHQAFDFWIGEWQVTNPDGSIAGHNTILKVQDNCILQENWVSAKGNYTGTSQNFYNSKTGQWEQIWIDNQGGTLHLKGNRTGNQMILQSDTLKNKEGNPYFHRITWTLNNDGSVRQLWETTTNNTEVVVAFDGLYKRK